MIFIKRHFPSSRSKWKEYIKIFLPMILGSFFYALNGVVDNFMVGHINQGQAALGAINSWTAILIFWFLGTAASGSVVMGQFYHAKKYDIVKEIARYRSYLCIIPAIILSIIAWTTPDTLTSFFYHGNQNGVQDPILMQNARDYSKIITIQWLFIAVSFNLGNQFREVGLGKYTMYWGIGALSANIILNSILMYGVHMGVEGAAWASVAGRVVSLTTGILLMKFKNQPMAFSPWTIFKVSWSTRKLIYGRWIYSFAIFTGGFFIIYRTAFYDIGYPQGVNEGGLGIGVSGLSVVALSGALMNVFTTTFSALTSLSSRFVASELGKNNLKQAKINADELKGFTTTMAFATSIIMVVFALCIPYMKFLAEDKYDSSHNLIFDGSSQLKNVSQALFVICLYYPMWIWFSSSYRMGAAGGKGTLFSIVDWVVSGLQLGWLAILSIKIVPGWTYAENHFWVLYILFFASDVFKLIGQEIVYYRYKWLNSLTNEKDNIKPKVELSKK